MVTGSLDRQRGVTRALHGGGRRVLVFAVGAAVLAGCSEGYQAERLYWKARQSAASLTKDPTKASPEEFEAVVRAFQRVIHKTPGTTWAARAQLTIGALSTAQKRYDEARAHYRLVLQNYNQYQELVLHARIGIAKTYEAEDQLEAAVKAYEEIADFHPWSLTGQSVPLYVAYAYERHGKKDEAMHAYERAVRVFTKRIPNAPTPELQAKTKGLLAHAYQRLGEWEEAIDTLETLVHEPAGIDRPLVLLTLGAIYQSKLRDRAQAQTVYEQLVQEFPEHPFGKVAQRQLDQLGVLPPAAADPAVGLSAPATP